MDITEIILHQHVEQRRMFAMLEEWPRDDHEGLAALWTRLAILLETHAEAEERYFYPELLKLGTGAADAESVTEEVEDAVKDHNEIREAVRKVGDAETGSDEWWTAVIDANTHNSDHMGEEERQDLADFRQQADLQLRHEIGVQLHPLRVAQGGVRHHARGQGPRVLRRGPPGSRVGLLGAGRRGCVEEGLREPLTAGRDRRVRPCAPRRPTSRPRRGARRGPGRHRPSGR